MLRDQNGLTEKEFLAAYRVEDYPRPSVACDMAVFAIAPGEAPSYRRLPALELRVLLIQRGVHPCLGSWALPGGFVRPGETVGQAAARELREETGLSGVYLEQLGVFSTPGRDPRTWVMSCAHLALTDSRRLSPQAGDDARGAAWFSLGAPPEENGRLSLALSRGEERLEVQAAFPGGSLLAGPEEGVLEESRGLAFDHGLILACALRRLRQEVEAGLSPLPFYLLPREFTLTQLQQVYEVILGRQLPKAAFRRKLAPLVEETGSYAGKAGHRPALLFRQKAAKEEQP
ncbi:MAG: NUDIX hydrolase [Angelakisella sp.]|jgi:8-oxo-dGTP diphosphatase|nr:NUDIX hydrolase [Angelakisella sp.]